MEIGREESFGTRLLDLREAAGYKRQELADKIGCSRAALEFWEKNKRTPDIYMVTKLADFFHVPTDWLIRGVSPQGLEYFRETGLNDDATAMLSEQKELAESSGEKSDAFNALLNGILSNGGFYYLLWSLLRLREELPPLEAQILELKAKKEGVSLIEEMRLDAEVLPLREKRDFVEWRFLKQTEAFYRQYMGIVEKSE